MTEVGDRAAAPHAPTDGEPESSRVVDGGRAKERTAQTDEPFNKNEVGETTAGGSDPIQEKGFEGQLEGRDVEEEGECGFCLFMKGGPCREEFIAWEKCVEEAEKNEENIVDKCFEVTGLLRKCMEAHTDYYEPILRAEKAMEEEAARELGRDQEANSDVAEPKMDTQEEKN